MERRDTTIHKDEIVVVSAADDNYAMPLAVVLHSVLTNLEHGSRVAFYVIDGGVTTAHKARLATLVKRARHVEAKLEWLCGDLRFLDEIDHREGYISAATYLKLLIPELLPGDIEKAIYLDSDLVVESSLNPLWQCPTGNHAVLAVPDFHIRKVSADDGVQGYKRLGLSPDTPYFNAGVLVLNLKRWREGSLHIRMIEYLRKYQVNRHEQEAINALLAGQIGALDARWNYQVHASYYYALHPEILQGNPHIIHYTGYDKPWSFKILHPSVRRNNPMQSRFEHYLKTSGWFRRRDRQQWVLGRLIEYGRWLIRGKIRRSTTAFRRLVALER